MKNYQIGRAATRTLSTFCIVFSCAGVWANGPKVVVEFRGRPLSFTRGLHPFVSQRTVLVPFRATAGGVGAKVSRDPDGKHVKLIFGGDTLDFEPGHHGYRLNGTHRNMRSSSEMRHGHLYVPVRLFNDLTAGRVHAEIRA